MFWHDFYGTSSTILGILGCRFATPIQFQLATERATPGRCNDVSGVKGRTLHQMSTEYLSSPLGLWLGVLSAHPRHPGGDGEAGSAGRRCA